MTLRWGIVSTGRVCADFVTAFRGATSASSVAAVASRTKDSAQKFADKFGISQACTEDELYSNNNVDVVYIGSINTMHYQSALKALNSKKHVVCEKPFTVNSKQLEQLIETAKKNDVFLMEGHWSRFFPAWKKIRQVIQSGTIGDVRFVQADFGYQADSIRGGDRITDPMMAGGSLYDNGSYPVSLATMAFGGKWPEKVRGVMDQMSSGVDEGCFYAVSYGNGKKASLSNSVGMHTGCDAKIVGSHGRINIQYPFWCPSDISVTTYDNENPARADPRGIVEQFSFPLPTNPGPFNFPSSEGFAYEIDEVHDCITTGKKESELMPLSESLAISKTMEMLRQDLHFQFPDSVEALNE